MDTPEVVEALAYRAVIDIRIEQLLWFRQWSRRQPRSAEWSPMRIAMDTELRALVKLARLARRTARPAIERQDPVTLGKAS